jgi:uncharacterized protein (DUF1800 family)
MPFRCSSAASVVRCWIATLFLILLIPSLSRAAIDLYPSDGLPDVWVLRYGATGLDANGDADADGIKNGAEAVAGTDPFSPGSLIRVSTMWTDADGVHFSFATEIGKRYQLQSAATPGAPTWTNEGGLLHGTGEEVTAVVTAPGATERFFRVSVQDIDSDGDGATDWEETQLGFNPNSPASSGASGADDFTAITQGLQGNSVVTIEVADPAASEIGPDPGTFRVRRSGAFGAISVPYSVSGTAQPGADYVALTGTVNIGFGKKEATITVMPVAEATPVVESNESVIVTLSAGAGHSPGASVTAAILISDNSFGSDGVPNGDGLRARYWNNTSSTVPVFYNGTNTSDTTPKADHVVPVVDLTETTTAPAWPPAGVATDYFVVRFSGEVLPEFSQVYTFEGVFDRGARLTVNGQQLFTYWTNNPSTATTTRSGVIELEAGRRYPVVYEFMARSSTATVRLNWQSANTNGGTKQVIPQARLFSNSPPQILSGLELLRIQGSPVQPYQIVASGEPTSFAASNLPPDWTINTTTGVLSGPHTTAGTWDIVLTASNTYGSGSAILKLTVIPTGGGITRDVWAPFTGTVAQIPPAGNPTSTSTIAGLSVAQSAPDADEFAARIRGYLTAPKSGVYKFWLTADDAAELWISDDDEAINSFRRAQVTVATAHEAWTDPNAGKSPLLWLEAGRRYYIEVRHKEGAGADHLAIGWLKPGDAGSADPANSTAPSEIVPAYALSPYVAPAPVSGESTLYTTSMTAQGTAQTSGYGAATVRLSADESFAVLTFSYANLTTPVTSMHIHDNAYGPTDNIVFDIDDAEPQPDGSFHWHIEPMLGYTPAQIVQHLKNGELYLNIHTAMYPAGEIKGFFKYQPASQTFTPPAAPPSWTSDHADPNAAARFLIQATFGVDGTDADGDNTPDAIEQVQALGYEGWIDAQFALPPSYHYPYVFANRNLTDPDSPTYSGNLTFNSWWRNAVIAPDQLRQRVAFALSEIMVVSEAGPLDDRADTLSDYYDMLLDYGLGNPGFAPRPGNPPADGSFLNLLKAVTLHPAMGRYLDMLNNRKPNISTGRIPNENYAREILQLFSIGLNRMWPDGSLMLNSRAEPVPTYDQDAIIGFSHAFTGWGYYYSDATFRTSLPGTANWIDPMREVPLEHYIGQKRLLNNVVAPGIATLNGQPIDPNASHSSAQYTHAAYMALPALELDITHRQIVDHPNTGPFICRQLIQRLVTSTPSRGYIYRVVQKFNDNGQGVRGDMRAVVKAILLDYEARSADMLARQGYGKQREPVARIAAVARAFPAPTNVTGTYSQTGNLITVSVSPAQPFANGNNVFLDFSGGVPSDPEDAAYDVSSVSTAGNATTFTVRPRSTESTAAYAQANATLTVTMSGTNDHVFSTTTPPYLDFTSGTPNSPPDGTYNVTYVPSDRLSFKAPAPGAVRGTYTQTGNTVTFTATDGHTFTEGQAVWIDFITASPSAAGVPVSQELNVVTASGNTFAVTYPNDAVTRTEGTANAILPANIVAGGRTGNVVATRASHAVNRSGNVALTYSDWNMDNTDTDLNQTPLRAPTVFNFFEPDYSYPGALAAAGLVTPEFQLTSDTSVMRQANFLYNGLFNDLYGSSVPGLSSFRSGNRDIALDFRHWMGAGPGGLPWAHNDNLGALIDKLNTLLLAGQLPSAGTNNTTTTPRTIVNAKQVIQDHVAGLNWGRAITSTSATALTRITAAGHGMTTGTSVVISGVTSGPSGINATHTATVLDANTFTIPITCTTASANLTNAVATPSGGTAKPITALQGYTTVTASSHGLSAGSTVTIAGLTGGTFSPAINGTFSAHSTPSSSAFVIPVTRVSSTGISYATAVATVPNGYPDLLRDRLRAVIHLIVTSPDFTIQK